MDTRIKLQRLLRTTISLFLLLSTMENTSANAQPCPNDCRCYPSRKMVYCMDKNLLQLPHGIPKDTKTLFLRNNRLVNGPDLDSILSGLTNLAKLDLSNNTLTSFPRNLPRSLTWISMKDNNVKYVGRQSLEGLDKLLSLYLDNNSITNQGLSPSAFSGARNLHTISLKWNRLTSFPSGLPTAIRYAQLSHNQIATVPSIQVGRLTKLVSLDLSYNRLTSESIPDKALQPLIGLQYLDLSHNKLTYIPVGLPGNLTELFASHNLVKAINAPARGKERPMSLSGLTFLEHLDLSFNRLQSVEPGSFSSLISLRTVILHDNPWQCDCHLKYLKSWLSETPALITMDSKTICFTPDAFQGVTLRSLDHVSLTCSPKQVPKYNISTAPRSITLLWSKLDSSYPDYVEYDAFCGVPKCENCSQQEIIDNAEREEYTYVSSIVKSYDLFPTDYKDAGNGFARIDISNRKPGRLYIVCLLGSFKDISELKIEDCDFIRTEVETTSPSPILENEFVVPVWLAVLIALLAILIIAAIVLIIYCQRLNAKKHKWQKGCREAPRMTYDPFSEMYSVPGQGTSRNDGLYDQTAVGGVNISNYRQGFVQGCATQDAGKEFDVTLMINTGSNHNLLHVPSPETCDSYCSDCHDDTISTSHTRTNTTDGSIGSQTDSVNHHGGRHHHPPPRYAPHTANHNGYITS